MQPPFFFRIDEIREADDALVLIDRSANAIPSLLPGANVGAGGGVSGKWFGCTGQQIVQVAPEALPSNVKHFKTYSMFYRGGFGFWVLEGDATRPPTSAAWHPLQFDYDPNDGYSSYLCNVAQNRTVQYRRTDQQWLSMLLPDVYFQSAPTVPYPQCGALKGELAIFLGLIAFSMQPTQLPRHLPNMFVNGAWQTHPMQHGRESDLRLYPTLN